MAGVEINWIKEIEIKEYTKYIRYIDNKRNGWYYLNIDN